MYNPLSSSNPFATPNDVPPWPTTPHSPNSPHPTLIKPSSPLPPQAPEKSPGPFGKEPQIYGQPEPGLISPRTSTATNGTTFERNEPYLRVRITGLDRNRRDILIRFDAQTNLANFTGSTYRNVSRSFVEFQRFAEQIVYSNPQTIIPALPLPQTSAPTDEEDDRLVKVMMQRWFTRICEDPILLQDEEIRSFIESDFGYQPTIRARRKTGGSGFSLLSRRPPDEDEELQRARFELTRLESQFFDAAKAVDKLSRTRKAMSVAHAELGNKLVSVATTEIHPPLASAVRKFGRTWHSLSDLDQAQSISECVILGDSLGYQGMNARSAKETLLQRSGVLEEYQTAVKTTISKRRNIERLKASSNIRPDRVDEALEEMEEANKIEQLLHRRVEGISQNLHRALQRHSRLAHEDITNALIEHARTTIMYERQLLRDLEALRPDVNAAAKPAVIPKLPVPQLTSVPSVVQQPVAPPKPDTIPTNSVSAPPTPSNHQPEAAPPISPTPQLVPASNPQAGPSSPHPLSASSSTSSHTTDPLTGSHFESNGTRSMLVQPSASTSARPPLPSSPLSPHATASTLGPRSASHMGLPPAGPKKDDPISRIHSLARSVQVEGTRSRLDAREAASKLANFL